MNPLSRLLTALKAARQLGLRQAGWYAVYQAGLRTSILRAITPTGSYDQGLAMAIQSPFALPTPSELADVLGERAAHLLAEADEIKAGRFRPYGGEPVSLQFAPPGPLLHWTAAQRLLPAAVDIKDGWEAARFGWAYTLGRAYRLSANDTYAAAFWQHYEHFVAANPPYQGLNWVSAQEVALRLMALVFAAHVFADAPSSTPARMALLAGVVAAHAQRIPPTLSYARAQHNNHLISETLGLLLAAYALPQHPQASKWQALGARGMSQALLRQIRPDGVYAQHSLNYHRLMLQCALMANCLPTMHFSPKVLARLQAAAGWLPAQMDPKSGLAPNYGHNDGALILPLAEGEFGDQRATVQAAARAFLAQPALHSGPWDELSLWLGLVDPSHQQPHPTAQPVTFANSPALHRLGDIGSWAILRTERYTSRPAHADQLHVDLWWAGAPVTLDAGSFRYNAAQPWQNALAATSVHNTITVDGQDQMQRAGRFLWLDWAQATLLESTPDRLTAEHNGYRRLGLTHRRTLIRLSSDHWQIEDKILPAAPSDKTHSIRLHWLLPNAPYTLNEGLLQLRLPAGLVTVRLSIIEPTGSEMLVSLARAGLALSGPPAAPIDGWYAPTYAMKVPALSFALHVCASSPLRLLSDFRFQFEKSPGVW